MRKAKRRSKMTERGERRGKEGERIGDEGKVKGKKRKMKKRLTADRTSDRNYASLQPIIQKGGRIVLITHIQTYIHTYISKKQTTKTKRAKRHTPQISVPPSYLTLLPSYSGCSAGRATVQRAGPGLGSHPVKETNA